MEERVQRHRRMGLIGTSTIAIGSSSRCWPLQDSRHCLRCGALNSNNIWPTTTQLPSSLPTGCDRTAVVLVMIF